MEGQQRAFSLPSPLLSQTERRGGTGADCRGFVYSLICCAACQRLRLPFLIAVLFLVRVCCAGIPLVQMGLKGTRGLRIGQSQQGGGGGRGGGGRGGGQQQGGGGRGGYGGGGQGRGGYGGGQGQGRPQSARY